MRSFVCAAAAAALAVSGCAAPVMSAPTTAEASASTQVVYGYAWADGEGRLRVVPKSETFEKHEGGFSGYRLSPVAEAKELRLDYGAATYGRVTVACDLKETEGQVALDDKGLGRTACKPSDLATELERGPVALRAEHRDGRATRINEILVPDWPDLKTAQGTIQRVDDSTVLFSSGGKQVKLGYTYATVFFRTTAKCGDGWLTGRPVNANQDGLGTKQCAADDLTEALSKLRHPVLVKVDYTPEVDSLEQVWEVFGDA
ncbi:hypothetical protein E1286_08360 [Nonomuraea terrae]|uniref:Lipoprotein n=1 Tax=Nonomuraea terrae TaxID=2530383 RepID=A0A4R4Z6Z0_9ACTN|nr:hypothetical protein [Nonomuraea terrae]TDD52874.1 hypothetical protein E1286_08360 [Nonomuraea terrae]